MLENGSPWSQWGGGQAPQRMGRHLQPPHRRLRFHPDCHTAVFTYIDISYKAHMKDPSPWFLQAPHILGALVKLRDPDCPFTKSNTLQDSSIKAMLGPHDLCLHHYNLLDSGETPSSTGPIQEGVKALRFNHEWRSSKGRLSLAIYKQEKV